MLYKKLTQFLLIFALFVAPGVALADWVQPSCNPDDPGGPTAVECKVSAPINISALSQTKGGPLTIQNTLTANQLQINGSATFEGTSEFNDSVTVNSNMTVGTSAVPVGGVGLEVFTKGSEQSLSVSNSGSGYAIYGNATNSAVYGAQFCNGGTNCASLGGSTYAGNFFGEAGSGLYATSKNANAIVAETVGTDAIDVYSEGGRAIVASSESDYGVYGSSEGSAGVFGESSEIGEAGVSGVSTSPQGFGVYGSGGIYAGFFDGNTNTQGHVAAANFVQTARGTGALADVAISSDGAAVVDDFSGFANMVFDGAEIWILSNKSTTQTRVYRFSAQDFTLNQEVSMNWTASGASSEMVLAANNPVRGVYFWNPAGETYRFQRIDTAPELLTQSGDPLMTNAITGIDTGDRVYVGRGNGNGVSYSTTLREGDASAYTSIAFAQWGDVVDMVMDGQQRVHALNIPNTGAAHVVRIDEGSDSTDARYDLPSGKTPQHMVFDGQYFWVTMQGSNDSIVRINPDNDEVKEVYLTDTGNSSGNQECTDPDGVTFDGAFVWVGCNGNSKLVRIAPTTGLLAQHDGQRYGLDVADYAPDSNLVFDGSYVWVRANNFLRKYYTGFGNGAYAQPWASSGINLISNDGNPYCLQINDVDGGTLFVDDEFCSSPKDR